LYGQVKPLLYIDRIIFSGNVRFIVFAKDHMSPDMYFLRYGISTFPGFSIPADGNNHTNLTIAKSRSHKTKFNARNSLVGSMERITAVAKGKVQGVGYRHFVANCAHMTGVHGFVRNMPDGSVKMVAESSRASLEDFVRRVRALEEPLIQVRDLSVTPCAATGEYKGFWVEW